VTGSVEQPLGTFRVAARTLLHLGAELISSDAVALYELVKNAFDAGSPSVAIDIVMRLPHEEWREFVAIVHALAPFDSTRLRELREEIVESVDWSIRSPDSKTVKSGLNRAATPTELVDALMPVNTISVSDTGEGMSFEKLTDAYLTVGTRSRLLQREVRKHDGKIGRPVLGEKGVGRLAAMRLGSRLYVESTTSGEPHWNLLEIDWEWFSHDKDVLLEDIPVAPTVGHPKRDREVSGTIIRIEGLTTNWTNATVEQMAAREFSRLTDPFERKARYPVHLRFNGELVPINRFNRTLLEQAHGSVEAHLVFDAQGEPRYWGRCHYQGRTKVFELVGAHLLSTGETHTLTLFDALGPFDMEAYWFNRRILTAVEGIGDRRIVQQLVRQWSGGLMVFRDGFRVMPYGSPDDDWLDLDRSALAAQGYKVNRAQLIGRVSIGSRTNPALMDQTNREGLRDSPEKHLLKALLRHALITEFRHFLTSVDREIRAAEPIDFDDLEERVEAEEQLFQTSLRRLIQLVPQTASSGDLVAKLNEASERLTGYMRQAKELAASYSAGRSELLNLAGIGLIVEILSHELNRGTQHALVMLRQTERVPLPDATAAALRTLEAQLESLQKRLSVLDPLSTTRRQRKESFDLLGLVRDTVAGHEPQFARHRISCHVVPVPEGLKRLPIKAVRGMIVQVLENLLANSTYWLKQQRLVDPLLRPQIRVEVDSAAGELRVSDNGPGIDPTMNEDVFRAFVTTKPAGEGKGLGLFISREIARYHGAELSLAPDAAGLHNALHTFVLSLEGMMA
jgi:signal transduction histidine kinase